MSFIKKNVNMALLLVILLIVFSFTVMTTYYQATYQNLSESYNVKLMEVEQLTQTLNIGRTELNKTYSELQIRVADKARFDKLYGDLISEKERLDAELSSTRQTLKNTQDQLTTTQLKLDEAQGRINELQQSVETYQHRVNSLQAQIDDLKAKCGAACQ